MYTFLIIIHLIVSFIMIGAILLQSGKGAEIGAAFGGSSQTIFGSRGAATFLSKMTVGAAIVFMLTSLSLAILSKQRAGEYSIMKSPRTEAAPPPAAGTPPAPPAATAAPSSVTPLPAAEAAKPAEPAAGPVTGANPAPSPEKK